MKGFKFIVGMGVAGALTVSANLWHLQAAPAAVDAADQRVAAELDASLRRYISSPGGKLNLVVKPTDRASLGYFSEVVISGKPVRVKKLQISELNLRAQNVRIDVPHMRSEGKVRTLTSNTTLRAVVTENDLTTLLSRGKHTKDMGLRVKYLGGDRMQVTGRLSYALVNGPIVGTGRLRLMPGSKVHLVIDSLQLRGHEVPAFVKDQLSSRINPVIDYEDLPFKPRFKGLKVNGTRAVLSA